MQNLVYFGCYCPKTKLGCKGGEMGAIILVNNISALSPEKEMPECGSYRHLQ